MIDKISKRKNDKGWGQEIQMMSERILVDKMIGLTKNPAASSTVRAITRRKLELLYMPDSRRLTHRNTSNIHGAIFAHDRYLASKIHTFLSLPEELDPVKKLEIPDGAPIGSGEIYCDH